MRSIAFPILLILFATNATFSQSPEGNLSGSIIYSMNGVHFPDSGTAVIIYPETGSILQDSLSDEALRTELALQTNKQPHITIISKYKSGQTISEDQMTQRDYNQYLKNIQQKDSQLRRELNKRFLISVDSTTTNSLGIFNIKLPVGHYGLIFRSRALEKCKKCTYPGIWIADVWIKKNQTTGTGMSFLTD